MQQQMQSPLLAAQQELLLEQLAGSVPQTFSNPVVRVSPVVNVSTGGGSVTDPTTFTFIQTAPSTVWDIVHNLGGFPSVTTTDSTGHVILGQVQYISSNEVEVFFSVPLSGTAYLNM